jgi:hypothetical protein
MSFIYLLLARGLYPLLLAFIYLFIFVVLGLELGAYTLSHSTSPFFVLGIFEIASHEQFAWVGSEP